MTGSGPRRPIAVNLAGIDVAGADGATWSLPHDGDLDANLVKLDAHSGIAEHRNDEVDVLVLVVAGSGDIVIDGEPFRLRPHHLVRVPKGGHRRIEAGPAGLVYLSVHRARAGLRVTARPAPAGGE